MMTVSKRKRSLRQKVANYRERMRAQGLRPVQIWVLDTRTPKFAAEAHSQSLAVARSPTEREDQAFVDSVSVLNEE
jgi:hypothetical protein